MARENIPVAPPRYVTVTKFPTAAQSWNFTSPELICVEDGNSTYFDSDYGPSLVWAYGFGFDIPVNSIITSLIVSVKAGPRAPYPDTFFSATLGTYIDGEEFVPLSTEIFSPAEMLSTLSWYALGNNLADWACAITPAILNGTVNQFTVVVAVDPVRPEGILFDAVKVTITYDTGYRTPRDGPHKKPTPRDPRPRPHTKPKLPRYE
jgi:hypothetical protein